MSQFSSKMNTRVKKIPAILENLCQQADLIIGVGDDNKICFKRATYVAKESWLGYFQRRFDGDKPTDLIQRITNLVAQFFEQYAICDDQEFCDLILSKLLDLRGACIRLRDTSYADYTSTRIRFNSIILSIDTGLPEDVRKRQGIPSIGANLHNTSCNNVVIGVKEEEKSSSVSQTPPVKPLKSPSRENGDEDDPSAV